MTFFHSIDAPKVGNHAMAWLAVLIAVGFDNLQIAARTAFVDPDKHTYMICPKIQLNDYRLVPVGSAMCCSRY